MSKYLFFIFLAALPVFGQAPYSNPINVIPFLAGNDTINSISGVDTIKWQIRNRDLNWPGAWNVLSPVVTAANKTGEQSVPFALAQEANWTHADFIRFQIKGATTLTSAEIDVRARRGALTLWVQPDTVTATPNYTRYLVRLSGQ